MRVLVVKSAKYVCDEELLTKKSVAKGLDIARRYLRGRFGLGRPAEAR